MPDGLLRQAKKSWIRNMSKRSEDRSKKPDHVDGSYRRYWTHVGPTLR